MQTAQAQISDKASSTSQAFLQLQDAQAALDQDKEQVQKSKMKMALE